MRETESFEFDGFGWACKKCAKLSPSVSGDSASRRSRLFTEGEAETKDPELSNPGLAKWFDEERRILYCPGCGKKESIGPGGAKS